MSAQESVRYCGVPIGRDSARAQNLDLLPYRLERLVMWRPLIKKKTAHRWTVSSDSAGRTVAEPHHTVHYTRVYRQSKKDLSECGGLSSVLCTFGEPRKLAQKCAKYLKVPERDKISLHVVGRDYAH